MRALVLLLVVVALVGCGGTGSTSPPPDPAKGAGGTPSPVAELQKLLDTIPKESQPRTDKDGTIERNKANQWLKEHMVGKPLSLSATATEVDVSPQGDVYNVSVNLGEPGKLANGKPIFSGYTKFGVLGTVRAGGADWPACLEACPFRGVDEATAKRLRDLKGKTVTVRGVVAETADFMLINQGPPRFMVDPGPFGEALVKGPMLYFALDEFTIDGIVAAKRNRTAQGSGAKEKEPDKGKEP